MWLFNFFLVERTLKQELEGKETSGKRDQGEFQKHALLDHQAVLHILLILLLLLLLQGVWKASRPSLLTCRDL